MSNEDEINQDEQTDAESEAPAFDQSGDESAYIASEARQPLSKGSVAMFVVLAAAGAGTYFMYARTGPQSASAATDVKAQQVIKQYMTERDRNVVAMQKMLRDTESVVQQFLSYPSVKQIPLANLSGNPFRLTEIAPVDPNAAPKVDDAREKKRREEERVAVLKAVNALQLQSVMHSDARKACMINNTLYTEGETVETFTIEKISPGSVVVRNGSYRFELRMQR